MLDIIDSPVVTVDADTSVEEACEVRHSRILDKVLGSFVCVRTRRSSSQKTLHV